MIQRILFLLLLTFVVFTKQSYSLSLSKIGLGADPELTTNDCYICPPPDPLWVSITADPAANWVFDHWECPDMPQQTGDIVQYENNGPFPSTKNPLIFETHDFYYDPGRVTAVYREVSKPLFNSFYVSKDDAGRLSKYMAYRKRLSKFVVVSSDYTQPGTNIPYLIAQDGLHLQPDDGNGDFSSYIDMLITEYRLLKNYKQNYLQTAKELYYAIKSFERLDKNAEALWRGYSAPNDLNGCFARCDATNQNMQKYLNGGHFTQTNFIGENPTKLNSIDNSDRFLEALYFVYKLGETETIDNTVVNFKELAKSNICNILDNMYHASSPKPLLIAKKHIEIKIFNWKLVDRDIEITSGIYFTWYLYNRVNGSEVEGDGMDGTSLIFEKSFSNLGNNILGSNFYASSNILSINDIKNNYLAQINNATQIPVLDLLTNFITNDRAYKIRSSFVLGNVDENLYSILKSMEKVDNREYEQFPLMYAILYDKCSQITAEDRTKICTLLDAAPSEGPWKFVSATGKTITYGNREWASNNRHVWPNHRDDAMTPGYYNGLDYMFLHNLYWLANASSIQPGLVFRRSKPDITPVINLLLDL